MQKPREVFRSSRNAGGKKPPVPTAAYANSGSFFRPRSRSPMANPPPSGKYYEPSPTSRQDAVRQRTTKRPVATAQERVQHIDISNPFSNGVTSLTIKRSDDPSASRPRSKPRTSKSPSRGFAERRDRPVTYAYQAPTSQRAYMENTLPAQSTSMRYDPDWNDTEDPSKLTGPNVTSMTLDEIINVSRRRQRRVYEKEDAGKHPAYTNPLPSLPPPLPDRRERSFVPADPDLPQSQSKETPSAGNSGTSPCSHSVDMERLLSATMYLSEQLNETKLTMEAIQSSIVEKDPDITRLQTSVVEDRLKGETRRHVSPSHESSVSSQKDAEPSGRPEPSPQMLPGKDPSPLPRAYHRGGQGASWANSNGAPSPPQRIRPILMSGGDPAEELDRLNEEIQQLRAQKESALKRVHELENSNSALTEENKAASEEYASAKVWLCVKSLGTLERREEEAGPGSENPRSQGSGGQGRRACKSPGQCPDP